MILFSNSFSGFRWELVPSGFRTVAAAECRTTKIIAPQRMVPTPDLHSGFVLPATSPLPVCLHSCSLNGVGLIRRRAYSSLPFQKTPT